MPAPGEEPAVAEKLCDGQETRAELAERLRIVRPELRPEDFVRVAVWVPRRDTSEIAGVLRVTLLGPEEGDEGKPSSRDYFRSLLEPDERTWCTVFSRDIEEIEIPAGPTLFVREIMTRHKPPESEEDETVTDDTSYVVFPPGSQDALNFSFQTSALELGAEMVADAAWMMDTLEVTLGEPLS